MTVKEQHYMKSLQVTDCPPTTAVKLERVNFFDRQLLTANDMITDRDYFLQKLRRHNRFLHGWGVVCGLAVTVPANPATPWQVQIGSGYALGPYGDEIFVGDAVLFDLAACLTGGVTNPCEPTLVTQGRAGVSTTIYLAIKYAECLSRPIRVAFSGCGCDNDPCQYSRISDSFQISCVPQLPPSPPQPTLCQVVRGGVIAPCPPCPTDPWVVLAKVILPSSTSMNIQNSSIDNKVRRVILSTAVLQDQLVRCCCGPASSSSSSSSIPTRPVPSQPALAVAALNVGQRATRIAGTDGAVQIAITVMNSGPQAAEDVVLTAHLSPDLLENEYELKPAAGWQTATLAQLKSAPVSIQPGRAHTFSFQIAPKVKSAAVTVTSKAFAAASIPGVSSTASPIQATIGG
jgi:hypothetical protein